MKEPVSELVRLLLSEDIGLGCAHEVDGADKGRDDTVGSKGRAGRSGT